MLETSNLHTRLGITAAELQALLDVRDDLESGRISKKEFDMGETACGSIACIGGHMAFRMGAGIVGAHEYVSNKAGYATLISTLFFPRVDSDGYRATPFQAVAAIDRWIASEGKCAW